eukprot:Pgem_evm2s19380
MASLSADNSNKHEAIISEFKANPYGKPEHLAWAKTLINEDETLLFCAPYGKEHIKNSYFSNHCVDYIFFCFIPCFCCSSHVEAKRRKATFYVITDKNLHTVLNDFTHPFLPCTSSGIDQQSKPLETLLSPLNSIKIDRPGRRLFGLPNPDQFCVEKDELDIVVKLLTALKASMAEKFQNGTAVTAGQMLMMNLGAGAGAGFGAGGMQPSLNQNSQMMQMKMQQNPQQNPQMMMQQNPQMMEQMMQQSNPGMMSNMNMQHQGAPPSYNADQKQ